uniref:Putative secreted protein salivary gland overexpressed n=1 Tax=Rhipicephalus microplus TaxID=6941 RepID=A0A6M2DAK4_RHIMP
MLSFLFCITFFFPWEVTSILLYHPVKLGVTTTAVMCGTCIFYIDTSTIAHESLVLCLLHTVCRLMCSTNELPSAIITVIGKCVHIGEDRPKRAFKSGV